LKRNDGTYYSTTIGLAGNDCSFTIILIAILDTINDRRVCPISTRCNNHSLYDHFSLHSSNSSLSFILSLFIISLTIGQDNWDIIVNLQKDIIVSSQEMSNTNNQAATVINNRLDLLNKKTLYQIQSYLDDNDQAEMATATGLAPQSAMEKFVSTAAGKQIMNNNIKQNLAAEDSIALATTGIMDNK
jgi:hypothetical protein